jgi:hypothetical protein
MRVIRIASLLFIMGNIVLYLLLWLLSRQELPGTAELGLSLLHSAVAIFMSAGVGAIIFAWIAHMRGISKYARLVSPIIAFPIAAIAGAVLGFIFYPLWESLVPLSEQPEAYQLVFGGAFWCGLNGMLFGLGIDQSQAKEPNDH